MKRIIFAFGVLLTIVFGASGVQAQAGNPAGAQCGTDSNCVFVTNQIWHAMYLGGLEGADQKCAQAAQAAGLPGTYKAWLSDHATSAASRLHHSSAPYKLTDGTVIATGWDDLTDGTLSAPINLSENGTVPDTGRQPWTNTTPNGSVLDARGTRVCDDWKGNPPYRTNLGNRTKADAGWTQFTSDHCVGNGHLYCFQQGPLNIAPTANPTAGEMLQNGGPSNLNDGDLYNFFDAWPKDFDTTKNTAFVQLEWPDDVRIGRIRIWGRHDYGDRISGSIVTVVDAAGREVYRSEPTMVTGHLSPDSTRDSLPYVELLLPSVSGKTLRMTGTSDDRHVLNVGEIQVFPPTH